jgi:hypothetical protein
MFAHTHLSSRSLQQHLEKYTIYSRKTMPNFVEIERLFINFLTYPLVLANQRPSDIFLLTLKYKFS